MKVTILYFASLREGLGIDRESVVLPEGVATLGQIRAWLLGRGGQWQALMAEGRAVRMAVNQRMGGPETPVEAGAEVAFFPPVTGG